MKQLSGLYIVVAAAFLAILGLLSFGQARAPLIAAVSTPVATPAAFATADTLNPFVCEVGSEAAVPVCHAMIAADAHPADELAAVSSAPCEASGYAAATYACQNVNLLSFVPLADFDSGSANDIWGWQDPVTNHEYALIGLNDGTGFVDISDPLNPLVVGKLPTHSIESIWRDIKVYNNYAFIVADYADSHGMQVFDLQQLRDLSTFTTLTETAHYDNIHSAHNIVINEASGFAYVVGTTSGVTCSGGLHMINIQDPLNPTFAGCYSVDGYTHDAQCVIYNGPDTVYNGRELCFNANTDSVAIVDVTDKNALKEISTKSYSNVAYTHQLWLTADQKYMVVNDELDELNAPAGRRQPHTYVWDISDLDEPVLLESYVGQVESIDHNLYIHEGYIYQANYQSGLRVLDAAEISTGQLTEVAYFDTYPTSDAARFNGAWSNYPFFASGSIVVSSIEQGLFVLEFDLPPVDDTVYSYWPLLLK